MTKRRKASYIVRCYGDSVCNGDSMGDCETKEAAQKYARLLNATFKQARFVVEPKEVLTPKRRAK